MIACAVTLLPLPDSPTTASVRPGSRLKGTPLTADTTLPATDQTVEHDIEHGDVVADVRIHRQQRVDVLAEPDGLGGVLVAGRAGTTAPNLARRWPPGLPLEQICYLTVATHGRFLAEG